MYRCTNSYRKLSYTWWSPSAYLSPHLYLPLAQLPRPTLQARRHCLFCSSSVAIRWPSRKRRNRELCYTNCAVRYIHKQNNDEVSRNFTRMENCAMAGRYKDFHSNLLNWNLEWNEALSVVNSRVQHSSRFKFSVAWMKYVLFVTVTCFSLLSLLYVYGSACVFVSHNKLLNNFPTFVSLITKFIDWRPLHHNNLHLSCHQ